MRTLILICFILGILGAIPAALLLLLVYPEYNTLFTILIFLCDIPALLGIILLIKEENKE